MNNPLFVVSPGLYIWSLVIFLLVLLILKKYAWTPLLDFLDQREKEISDSLAMAESAKADLEKVKEESEKILNEAKNLKNFPRGPFKTPDELGCECHVMHAVHDLI